MSPEIPLVIEFVSGSLLRRPEPGAIVELPNGHSVSLPVDQIVLDEQSNGSARVGLGGMSFEGLQEGQLIFWRVKDLQPDDLLAPDRELRLMVPPEAVSSIYLHGRAVWPKPEVSRR